MQARAVAAGRGWVWFVDGWRLFARHPMVWLLLGLIFVFLMFVSLLIPVVGQLVFVLASPALGAGMLYAARESNAARTPRVTHLWEGFRHPQTRNRLFGLAGVALAGALATSLLMSLLMRDAMLGMAGQPGAAMPDMNAGFWLRLLVVFAPQLIVATALANAVPLVMFRDAAVGAALGSSLEASVRNILPLLVFGLVYVVAAIVVSIPFGLGWLLLLPASVGMLYSSYRDLYEPPETPASAIAA